MNKEMRKWVEGTSLVVLEMRVRELSHNSDYLRTLSMQVARQVIGEIEVESPEADRVAYVRLVRDRFGRQWREELGGLYDLLVRRLHENDSTLWSQDVFEVRSEKKQVLPIEQPKVSYMREGVPQPSGRMVGLDEIWREVGVLGDHAVSVLRQTIEKKAALAAAYLGASDKQYQTIVSEMAVSTLFPLYQLLHEDPQAVQNVLLHVPSVDQLKEEVVREYGRRKTSEL